MPVLPAQCSTSAMWDCQLKKQFPAGTGSSLPVPSQTHHTLRWEHEHFLQGSQFSLGVGHSEEKLHGAIPNGLFSLLKDLQLCQEEVHGCTWPAPHNNTASALQVQVTGFSIMDNEGCPDNAAPVEPGIWLSSLTLSRISGFFGINSTESSIIFTWGGRSCACDTGHLTQDFSS